MSKFLETLKLDSSSAIRTVIEGKHSVYWKILKNEINEMIKAEEEYLKRFISQGISRDDIPRYNRSVDRIYYLHKMLTINERIIEKNKTFVDRFRDFNTNLQNNIESFVRRNINTK